MRNQYNNSNEWASGVFSDASGNGNTNVQLNASLRGAWMNPGIKFNGSSSAWNFRTNAIPLTADFSFSVWFSNDAPSSAAHVLIGFYSSAAPYDQFVLYDSLGASPNQTNGKFRLEFRGVSQVSLSSAYWTTGILHNITCTMQTNSAQLYLDGLLVNTDTSCDYIATQRVWGVATIGCWGAGLSHTASTIYEVDVWHRALTSNEQYNIWMGKPYMP